MDIKAMQAEGANKATAWLTQNLPSEERTSPPPQSEQAAPPTPPAVVTPPPAPTPEAPVVPKAGMAEAIRRDREERARVAAAQSDANKYKTELETLRKENAELKALGAATDPFEFLRGRRLTKEEQALWGQAFLYDLKPEVAPQEFRLELYKADQARKEKEKADADRLAAEESARASEAAHLDRYANSLLAHVQSSPGSNPESEMWFTEDGPDGQSRVNHRVYAQSLLATANNLAALAQRTGQQVDLSPANVARVLEAEVSKRQKRRDAKKAGSAGQNQQGAPVQPGPDGKQAVETTATTSAAGLRGGPPLPPDMSDEARRNRAAAVLFNPK